MNAVVLWNVGNLEEAIENLTEAILLNPTSAIMYATRGEIWVEYAECGMPSFSPRYFWL